MQINLSLNALCGIMPNGTGTYTADGIKAIAESISVSPSLTQLSIGDNPLGDDGFRVLLEGCKASSSLATLDLGNKTDWVEGRGFHLGVKGAQMAADLLRVSPSLTSVRALRNIVGVVGSDGVSSHCPLLVV